MDLAAGKPEMEAPAKEVPSAADSTIPAEAMITQEYVQKAVFFLLILAVILYVVRRRRSSHSKINEKSMA